MPFLPATCSRLSASKYAWCRPEPTPATPLQAEVIGTPSLLEPTAAPSTCAKTASSSKASERLCHPPALAASGPSAWTTALTLSRCSKRQEVELMIRQVPTIGAILSVSRRNGQTAILPQRLA